MSKHLATVVVVIPDGASHMRGNFNDEQNIQYYKKDHSLWYLWDGAWLCKGREAPKRIQPIPPAVLDAVVF